MNRHSLVALVALLPAFAGCAVPTAKLYAATADETISGDVRANAVSALGDTLDLEDDLGFSDEEHPIEVRLVVAKRHRLWELGYTQRSFRSSIDPLAETGWFAGERFDAGNEVETSVSMDDYRAYLGVRAVRRTAICFARLGLAGVDWTVELEDSDGDKAEVSHLIVFPVAGVGFRLKLGPFASLTADADAMDMELGDTRAHLVEWRAGVEIFMVQGVTLKLGYRSQEMLFETEDDRMSLGLDGPTLAFEISFRM